MFWLHSPRGVALLGAIFTVVDGLSVSDRASGQCYYYHAHVHQHGTLTGFATVPTTGMVVNTSTSPLLTSGLMTASVTPVTTHCLTTSNVFMPTAVQSPMFTSGLMTASVTPVTTPFLTTSSVLMPTAVQSPMFTSGLMTASVPTYTTHVLVPMSAAPSTASPLLGGTSSPASLLRPSSQVASVTADYYSEYREFAANENALHPAGLMPAASDIAALNSRHPALTNAIGAQQLGSIGRFLVGKLKDPNFRSNALKLFEPFLGTLVPGLSPFLPLVNSFLDELQQGAGGGTTTAPNPTPVSGGQSGFPSVIHVIIDNAKTGDAEGAAPPPPKPGPVVASSPKNLEEIVKHFGGTIVGTDASGVTTAKIGGVEKKFDKDGIP